MATTKIEGNEKGRGGREHGTLHSRDTKDIHNVRSLDFFAPVSIMIDLFVSIAAYGLIVTESI